MALTHILPDPNHPINAAGQADVSGIKGPGYAGVSLNSVQPLMKYSSNSWRKDIDEAYHHRWKVDISYNPLTCEEFHTVYAFVNYRRATLTPFYVSIPPYASQVLAGITVEGAVGKGGDVLLVDGTGVQKGYLFNFADSTKAYKVTRVETTTDYVGTTPGAGKERIHITPRLQQTALNNTVLTFSDPLILVNVDSNTVNYTIDKDGLFGLSLSLVEVLPNVS